MLNRGERRHFNHYHYGGVGKPLPFYFLSQLLLVRTRAVPNVCQVAVNKGLDLGVTADLDLVLVVPVSSIVDH